MVNRMRGKADKFTYVFYVTRAVMAVPKKYAIAWPYVSPRDEPFETRTGLTRAEVPHVDT